MKLKVAVFGAAGIIGQHMRLCVPAEVDPRWMRRHADTLHLGLDLNDDEARDQWLDIVHPDVVVNLAGENRPDVVEADPARGRKLNVAVPYALAHWCDRNHAKYIHVSTQAVFGGDNKAPYTADAERLPVNEYGRQKLMAEQFVEDRAIIVRPSFVIGVRPMPAVGRANPAEYMIEAANQRHVNDRFFSVTEAPEIATHIWKLATGELRVPVREGGRRMVNSSLPDRVSRYELATMLNNGNVAPATSDDFPGIAPRPLDTTYACPANGRSLAMALTDCAERYEARYRLAPRQRARELAIFFGLTEAECYAKLSQGFLPLHAAIGDDFRRDNPLVDHAALLDWYRKTEGYIWELSAYHCDPGFNYSGMCSGIAESLCDQDAETVLCLGDGIGDLSLMCAARGLRPVYNDLEGSRTAAFARARFEMYSSQGIPQLMTDGWTPVALYGQSWQFDAVVSLDFLEHVPNVEEWVRAIKHVLKPGGLFFAQNAFNCGSGPDGSIPMHLKVNDHWEKDWDPLLESLGFEQKSSNWYRKRPCCEQSVNGQGDLVHEASCQG
jgi:dTDP-4-dehydrorhamnose reductase/SAM-dependent methyltransferase